MAMYIGDEELLLGEEEVAEETGAGNRHVRRACATGRLMIVLALAALAVAALTWRSGPGAFGSIASELSGLQSKASEPGKPSEESVQEREEKRKKMRIEGDLRSLVSAASVGRDAAQTPSSTGDCTEQAEALFDSVAKHSGLDKELSSAESDAFKARFSKAMSEGCTNDPLFLAKGSQWLDEAGDALERAKPVMTKSLADKLNEAKYGFQVEMRDWMVHESKTTFNKRLGRTPLPKDAIVSKPEAPRGAEELPESFNSAEKWPQCRSEIMRIHNQGHCGSCWSFSCTQVLDARTCIGSDGKFHGSDARLAPGFFASCAANEGSPGDGCTGGWEYYCYVYMDKPGTPGGVSEACSPYFASGAGIEHFDQTGQAPACPERCQANYSRTLAKDGFKLPSISAYTLVIRPDSDAHLVAKRAIYDGGSINYGIFAYGPFFGYSGGIYDSCNRYSANHAVVAYGFFPGGYLSKNSWGPHWGEDGLFRIADCIVTDFTVPGQFDSASAHIPYPLGRLLQ